MQKFSGKHVIFDSQTVTALYHRLLHMVFRKYLEVEEAGYPDIVLDDRDENKHSVLYCETVS
jgi:hypothetical protein